jgi:glycosyltransferase involved in cell wall biosynthesis
LHVVGSLDRGGVETWLAQVLRHLESTTLRMDFVVHARDPGVLTDEVRRLGARVFSCPGHRNLLSYGRRFRSILSRNGPFDVVHSHVHHFSGFVLRLAHQAKIPSRIAHSHSRTPTPRFWVERLYQQTTRGLIHRHCTAGLAASRESARALFGPSWATDPRFQVLHCGIDLAPFRAPVDRHATRAELGITDELVLAHVGRFVPAKNHAFLLRVASAVMTLAPRTRLLLMGDGPMRPAIESAANDLGIAERVSFLRTRTDVPRILVGASDAFVFPSRYEGLGLALIEAQAAGLPCFYSDTVSPEAAVVKHLLHPLSSEAPASEWANQILTHGHRVNGNADALDQLGASAFDIARSSAGLAERYAAQLIQA